MTTAIKALEKINQAKDKFIAIYQAVHKCDTDEATNFYEVEAFSFQRQIEESASLNECSELSTAGVFLEVISNGLSFEKSAKHVYMVPRSVKVGPNEWEKRLTYTEAADGIIYLCVAAKSINSCSEPIIVYEGDKIAVQTKSGITNVVHTQAIPRSSKKILGGFCIITLPDGNTRDFWMGVEDVNRLKEFSNKSNRGSKLNDKANSLYTSGEDGQIDIGFFATKIVKAALKRFRKKKTLNDYHSDENNDFEYDYSSSPEDSALEAPKESVLDKEPPSKEEVTETKKDPINQKAEAPLAF